MKIFAYEVWKVSRKTAEKVFETNFYSVALQALKEHSEKLTEAEIDAGYKIEVRRFGNTDGIDERPYDVVAVSKGEF